MSKLEKIVNRVYTLGGLVLLITVIMAMSSCGSSKMYHIGTGKELPKSSCTGNYIFGNK
jgi:hypothetical protein